jgi:endogenous inhibitor of DNA gyrase (YacG/DUF329 family)
MDSATPERRDVGSPLVETRSRGGMAESDRQVMCPICNRPVDIEPEWRLVQCPRCSGMITRMSEDSSFD